MNRKEAIRLMGEVIHNLVVTKQAAFIEWKYGAGASAAMQWIANDLEGPGLIPSEDDPHGKDAQKYYAANRRGAENNTAQANNINAPYFVVIGGPDGNNKPLMRICLEPSIHAELRSFESETQAELAALTMPRARKYGFEVFELGGGVTYYPGEIEQRSMVDMTSMSRS